MDAKPKDMIDHINKNSLDNRKCNLRFTNKAQNDLNRKGANKNSKSGERNVCWIKREQKWFVQLQVEGKNTVFGKFEYENLDKAIELARRLRKEIYEPKIKKQII